LPAAQKPAIEILPFEPRYARDFEALNLEWLRKYFRVEPIDEVVLSCPDRILERGGSIVLARVGERIVGTCALLKAGENRFELSKMAVTDGYQGIGIGRLLLAAVIDVFTAQGAGELYLESNSVLQPALKLYESVGFEYAPRPSGPAHYARADVYMIYRGPRPASPRTPPSRPV
jgi:GNAT superfamily N-acetyltransferase